MRLIWHIGSPAELAAATTKSKFNPEHFKNPSNLTLCLFKSTALLQKQTCHGSGLHAAQENSWCFLSCTEKMKSTCGAIPITNCRQDFLWEHLHQPLPRQLSHSTGTNPKFCMWSSVFLLKLLQLHGGSRHLTKLSDSQCQD